MSMKLWGALSLGALLAVFSIGPAQADDAAAPASTGDTSPYFAAQYLKEFSDYKRQSSDGNGYQLSIGLPFSYLDDTAIEADFSALSRKRSIDGNKDYQQALMFNLVHDYGLFGWNGDFTSKYLPKFTPISILGLGVIREDVRGDRHYHFGADAGGGLLFPLPWYGMSVRTTAVAQVQVNNKSAPGRDYLLDYHVTVGLQIPLTPLFERIHSMSSSLSTCGLSVVNLFGTRSDCVADSDHDGVPDVDDQCPGTPTGVSVDAKGCPVVGGVQDSDGDGVPDSQDNCPNTQKGVKVDANGCAVNQTLSLPDVQFEVNSAVLTEASKTILNGAAKGLNGQKNLKVLISGYTDASGNSAYNQKLSAQRAESVRQYLIAQGVDASRMESKGFGSADPKADNSSAAGREQNRRVEFKLTQN
ncbi:MAG: OmpA family protein [Stenotrophobium sp.]